MVEAGKEDEVRLVLDGVSITSPDYSAICAGQSGLLTIVLEDGTENKVSDGNTYTYPRTGRTSPMQPFSAKIIWCLKEMAC